MTINRIKDFFRKYKRLWRFLQYVKVISKTLGERSPLVYKCRGFTSNRIVRNVLKVIVSPFYLWDFFRYKDIPGRKGLAFVLIAKNEAPYIEEWLNFHVKQGVSHFLIYDNESTDNLHEILKQYIDKGLVTYQKIRGKLRQLDAYNMTVINYGSKFKYMGFIDADEFMFVRNNTEGGGGLQSL